MREAESSMKLLTPASIAGTLMPSLIAITMTTVAKHICLFRMLDCAGD